MSINSAIEQLEQDRDNIRTALKNRNVDQAESHNFADFAQDIQQLASYTNTSQNCGSATRTFINVAGYTSYYYLQLARDTKLKCVYWCAPGGATSGILFMSNNSGIFMRDGKWALIEAATFPRFADANSLYLPSGAANVPVYYVLLY